MLLLHIGDWIIQYCADQPANIFVFFIASKSRVAPLKTVFIPRLELQGALLASRLATVIQDEHYIKPVDRYFWTDSTTVLHCLRNENRNYKIFNANRLTVHIIQDLTLHLPVPDPVRFSCWTLLLRSTATLLLSVQIFKKFQASNYITFELLHEAEILLLRYSQQKSFPNECKALSKNRAVYTTSRLWTLNPYSDKRGILRACPERANLPRFSVAYFARTLRPERAYQRAN
jgi:hypothetical protein